MSTGVKCSSSLDILIVRFNVTTLKKWTLHNMLGGKLLSLCQLLDFICICLHCLALDWLRWQKLKSNKCRYPHNPSGIILPVFSQVFGGESHNRTSCQKNLSLVWAWQLGSMGDSKRISLETCDFVLNVGFFFKKCRLKHGLKRQWKRACPPCLVKKV